MIMEFDNNPSNELMEIDKIKVAYFFLCHYVENKYGEPSTIKLDDDLLEEDHPYLPSHDHLFHNVSYLEKG